MGSRLTELTLAFEKLYRETGASAAELDAAAEELREEQARVKREKIENPKKGEWKKCVNSNQWSF